MARRKRTPKAKTPAPPKPANNSNRKRHIETLVVDADELDPFWRMSTGERVQH